MKQHPRRLPVFVRGLGPLVVLLAAGCAKVDDQTSGHSATAQANVSRAQGPLTEQQSGSPIPVPFKVPSCDSLLTVDCFRDTAFSFKEIGWPIPAVGADWIIFGGAGDSVEVFASAGSGDALYGASITTNFGQEHDLNGNTAPYKRFRLAGNGVVTVWVHVNRMLGDTVAYTLGVHRIGPEHAAFRGARQWATLTIASPKETDRFTVVPVSAARLVSDLQKWMVYPRIYRVALVADSLYELCRVPCLMPDTVKLKPSTRVTRRY